MTLDLNTRQTVINVVDSVGYHADMRQWSELRILYADEIQLDYSSLVGGGPITINADDLIGAWTVGLTKYVATQHMTSCTVPDYTGTELSRDERKELWDKYSTAAPARQRQSVEQSKIVKRA